MARQSHGKPTGMERDAIATIRQLRAAHLNERIESSPEKPAQIMHDILRGYHGNVKLRLEVISGALGCTMRTLEREFIAQYSETMSGFQERMRLEYAEMQITYNPYGKLMALAAELGYERESEFNRFFRRRRGESVSHFARRMQEKLKDL